MSTTQGRNVETTAEEPGTPVAKPNALLSDAPLIPPKVVLPESTIGVRELKNNLTRIVSTVRNEHREFVITVHGQPVAVLRPYTEEDAIDAWEKAADQEIAEMLEAAKRISAAWQSEKSGLELLEDMREESACR